MSDDGFDPWKHDVRHLTPQQWTVLRKGIVGRARDERNRAIRRMILGAIRAVRNAWRRIQLRQEARAALCSMNDRELRDIGLSRCCIEGAIRRDLDAVHDRHRYGVPAQPGCSYRGSDRSGNCRVPLHDR
jgi:uncharacterized protein YjiS (DUF1127 family)